MSALDPKELTPLTPEIISRQATINIGTIGHVAHGKFPPPHYMLVPIICLCIVLFVLLITHTLIEIYPGKSTVVKAITGVQTVRFKNELERNITIKLGYANAKLYQVCPENVGASNHLLLSLSLNTMCTSFVVDNQTCRRKEWTKVS